jgi:hypothetical protein
MVVSVGLGNNECWWIEVVHVLRSEGVERCSRLEWSRLKRDRKRNRQDERRQRQVPRDREWLETPCTGGSFQRAKRRKIKGENTERVLTESRFVKSRRGAGENVVVAV